MLLHDLFRRFEKKLAQVPAGRLVVCGELEGAARTFGPEDLRAIEAEFQTADVGSFMPGAAGRAVRLEGVLRACAPKSGPLYLNAASRDGSKRLALWLAEVAPLAWIAYERGAGGPIQLLLPGFPGPRATLDDLALLEVSSHGERERGG